MYVHKNAKIIQNTRLSSNHFKLTFLSKQIADSAKPGQFLEVKCAASVNPFIRRPFSIFSVDKKSSEVSVVYKVIGPATEMLSAKKSDEFLDVIGPLGNGFSCSNDLDFYFVVGGGIGIAPLYFLVEELLRLGVNKDKIQVLFGAMSKDALVCKDDFLKLGVDIMTATDDGTCGNKDSVCGLFERQICKAKDKCKPGVFLCGPKPMLRVMKNLVFRAGFKTEVCLEEYMACGMGVCMGCAVKMKDGLYKYVCKDGPVFDIDQVDI